MLSQPGVDRTYRLAPDYALDWDRFASGISGELSGNAVGWAYAIAHEGAVLRSGAGGARRTAADGGRLAFTTKTKAQTASAAKTINAAALLKALREAGLDVDTKVQSFLPSCWQRGTGVATLTFRQILNHTSGLPKVSCNFGDGYECLVKMIEAGRTEPRTRSYNTHAYDLLRFLVPAVVDRKGTMAQVELLKCKNTAGVLNRKVSERFVRYVFRRVLEPIGVEASYHAAGEFSLNYDEDRPGLKGDRPRDDFFVRGGSGKLAMSAVEYVRFLSALDRGLIVPKGLVDSMKGSSNDNRLGFDGSVRGVAGEYHRKTGSCPAFPGTTFADPSFPPPTESGYDSRRHPWVGLPDTIQRHAPELWDPVRPLYDAGRYGEAADRGRELIEARPDQAYLYYNVACCESLAGRSADAIEHLRRAVDRWESCRELAMRDPDFDPIRAESAFQELIGR